MKQKRLASLALAAFLVIGISSTALAISKNPSIDVTFNDIKLRTC